MRYFFRAKIPAPSDVLLIESGSPDVAHRAMLGFRKIFPSARYHLCTCHPDSPANGYASIYRVTDYRSAWAKLRLLVSFWRRGWSVLVILCTGEGILWRWKTLAVLLLPAKVLVVNENADFFWLDWENRRTLRSLLGMRWGLNLELFFYDLLRALVFPLTFLLLLATAGFLYLRRALRLAAWRMQGRHAKDLAPPEPSLSDAEAPNAREPKSARPSVLK